MVRSFFRFAPQNYKKVNFLFLCEHPHNTISDIGFQHSKPQQLTRSARNARKPMEVLYHTKILSSLETKKWAISNSSSALQCIAKCRFRICYIPIATSPFKKKNFAAKMKCHHVELGNLQMLDLEIDWYRWADGMIRTSIWISQSCKQNSCARVAKHVIKKKERGPQNGY